MTTPLTPFPKDQGLLLHSCCGPCLAFPARALQAAGQPFVAWFHNPNIHPAAEHQRRLAAFFDLARQLHVTAAADSAADPDPWLADWPDKEARCRMCYQRRLQAAARETARRGLAAFTSTLLISPWQDRQGIVALGQQAAQEAGVRFWDPDWRPSYRQGQQLARQAGVYRQRYCGCLPSIEDSRFKDQIRAELAALSASPAGSDAGRTRPSRA